MALTVRGLAVTAVKGTRCKPVSSIALGPAGVVENRRFYLVDADHRLVNGKQLGELSTVMSDYDHDARRLALTFADGRVVDGEVALGATVQTRFFSSAREARIVEGPWSDALSELTGQPVHVVEPADGSGAVDRGAIGTVSLVSRASLTRLGEAGGVDEVDVRRLRMLIEIDGADAHAEDRWVGQEVAIGEAVVRMRGHVGRCLVTSRDPDTGVIDLPTLDILRSYRGELPSTEPLPFGIYGEVVRPGAVRVDDAVAVRG